MTILRIDACGPRPVMHSGAPSARAALDRALERAAPGPVLAMVHGFKYCPGLHRHCPHRTLFAPQASGLGSHGNSWLPDLGFAMGRGDGLALAFGWNARGPLWAAQRRARDAGNALARVLAQVHARTPDRGIHILAHSLGAEVALEALHHLPSGAVGRIVLMTGAAYDATADAALATPAGQTAELINITSRENDLFDFLFERLIAPPARGAQTLGQGLQAANAVTLQIDCAETLTHIRALGAGVADPERRICHWSAYMRPGVIRFYAALLRDAERWPLALLGQGAPDPAPRWSRLIPPLRPGWGLQAAQKAS